MINRDSSIVYLDKSRYAAEIIMVGDVRLQLQT